MAEFLSIGAAAFLLGVAVSTLRRWEKESRFFSDFRTPGGHRRYALDKLLAFCGQSTANEQRRTICYARVSSHDQKKDLQTQIARLQKHAREAGYEAVETIDDLGSGLNYKKRGLKRLIKLICQRKVKRLVIVHKDRLLRFGAELLFALCQFYGTEVVILEEVEENFEQQLCHDVLALMTVFSARLHGSRSRKNQRAIA
ncbi:IS607 family transposase OrfA [Oleiphilus messinensis]|uniref:IS607 family transposase OrfA n=2 Tax=Oleiphilus messinensis TaxID=141451 RepID=A0A1Y0ICL2_9GAMM|nr:IS607 family transposase [Oleiphilus messinensis]ARU54163.1 IS607 family transposase OrfA [Oleiphilus messinensis]ARU57205.1 IS607 family transposase OrfA [Oleiphilus messinensis]